MHDNNYNTPNRGKLIDLSTGIVYDFLRPNGVDNKLVLKWIISVNDVVTFDIVGGMAVNVELLHKHFNGLVFSN